MRRQVNVEIFLFLELDITSLTNEVRDGRSRLGARLAALRLPGPGLGEEHVRGEVVPRDLLRGNVNLHQFLIIFILRVLSC